MHSSAAWRVSELVGRSAGRPVTAGVLVGEVNGELAERPRPGTPVTGLGGCDLEPAQLYVGVVERVRIGVLRGVQGGEQRVPGGLCGQPVEYVARGLELRERVPQLVRYLDLPRVQRIPGRLVVRRARIGQRLMRGG